MRRIQDLGWWYWFLTVGLLGSGLSGWPTGTFLAMVLCAVQIAHVIRLSREVAALAVQVRIAYLAMLIAGLWEPLQWIHWLQLAGTTARVLIGYCLLAKILSLAPWNRWQPLSFSLIRRTLLSLHAAVPPCGEAFRQMSLEQVQGSIGNYCAGMPTGSCFGNSGLITITINQEDATCHKQPSAESSTESTSIGLEEQSKRFKSILV